MALFPSLSEKLQDVFKKLKGKGKLSEKDVKEAMREVQIALLEADVNYRVVKDFIKRVNDRAVGAEVMESLTPGQQVVKIVNEELIHLMGGEKSDINFTSKPPTIVMMVGLHGSGKTTTCGKIAMHFKKKGKRPLLVACDVYRAAAVEQLQIVGSQIDIPVFSEDNEKDPVKVASDAVKYAVDYDNDLIILDTAGRLHIDEELMGELRSVKSHINPHEILLVVDAMTGQDAVNVAKSFNEDLGIDGVVLTKLDGDTRGGAALSIRSVADCPIKFTGVGEKLDALEDFYPDRMASRILGMGDVLSLIEKAQDSVDVEKAKEMEKKMKEEKFTLEDFLEQLEQMKNMGSLEEILSMIPGSAGKQLKNLQLDEKELVKSEAIIQSMTPLERANPELINSSRKKRIAKGSGTRVQDVNRLLKQFNEAQKMMRQLGTSGKKSKKTSKNILGRLGF